MDTKFHVLVKNHFVGQVWLAIWLLLALLSYVTLSILNNNFAKPVIDLLLLATLVAFFLSPSALRKNSAFRVFGLALVAALISWALMLLQHPNIAESSPQVHKLTYWMFLIPIAFAFGGDTRKVIGVWLLAGAVLLLAPWLLGSGFVAIKNGLQGFRTDLNLLNAQHGAMYFAVLVVASLAFLPQLLKLQKHRLFAVSACLIVLCYALVAVIITQTRAVWLGLFIAIIFQITLALRVSHASWRRVLRIAGMVIIPLILVIATNWQLIQQRILVERNSVSALWSDNKVAFDSAGIRIHFWLESLHWIAERPIVGWGVEGKKMVIQQAESFPDSIKQQDLSHLHNSFLDALVNFGLLGLASIIALWVYMVWATTKLWRRGEVSNELLVFYLSFLVLWFVINCFESYMQFASGRFVFALISGGMLSLIWRSEYSTEKPA